MEKISNIKHISIQKLWGVYDFDWELENNVQVLIGVNGSGKSTILNLIYGLLTADRKLLQLYDYESMQITTNAGVFSYDRGSKMFPSAAANVRFITSFDKMLSNRKKMNVIKSSYRRKTDLDTDLAALMNLFIAYQLDASQEVRHHQESHLSRQKDTKALKNNLQIFFEKINKVLPKYAAFIDSTYVLSFRLKETNSIINCNQLSSGEKQLLILLMEALLSENEAFIFLLDEPELSLHSDLQTTLISNIQAINKNIQLIIVTHSALIVKKGFMDKYIDIKNLLTNGNK